MRLRIALLVVPATLAVLAVAVSPVPAIEKRQKSVPAAATEARVVVPSQLVGVWTRTVAYADAQHAGGAGIGFVGDHCTLTIKMNGRDNASLVLVGNGGGKLVGDVVAAGTGRVHIQLGSPAANVYRWKVSGRLLTLTKVSDGAPDRIAIFAGAWKRK